MANQSDSMSIAGLSTNAVETTAAAAGVTEPRGHSFGSPTNISQTPRYSFRTDINGMISRSRSMEGMNRGGNVNVSQADASALSPPLGRTDSGRSNPSSSSSRGSHTGDSPRDGDKDGGDSAGMTPIAGAAEDHGDEAQKNRKRKTGSSRGVANLTAAQLARKRANDREAQRAIRKRTKEQIEGLERKVRELSSQQPYHELTRVSRERDVALAENEGIKKRLATVMAIIQPIMDASGLTEQQLATAPPTIIHDPSNGSQVSLFTPTAPPNITSAPEQIMVTAPTQQHLQPPHFMSPMSKSLGPPSVLHHHHPSQHTSAHTSAATAITTPTITSMSMNSPFTSNSSQTHSYATPSPPTSVTNLCNTGWPELLPQQSWSIGELMDYKKRSLSQTLELSDSGERLGFNFVLDDGRGGQPHVPMLQDMAAGDYKMGSMELQQQQQQQQHQQQSNYMRGLAIRGPSSSDQHPRTVEFMQPDTVVIRNLPPTCPMDGILLDFLSSRRRKAAEGASSRQLVGPPYPSVSSLLNSSSNTYSHPISKVFTEILSTFPHLDALPDRVAVLYIMFLLMRWQIYPTKENYERLPDWLMPLPCQFTTAHPAWMDYLIFPRLRERMVPRHTEYDFASWFIPYTADLSVNWPYEPTDALLATAGCDELLINPVFEQHLRNIDNWSLGPRFRQAFPHLTDAVRIKEA